MQAEGAHPPVWLARTKLLPPPPRPDVLSRPRLVERLRTAALSSRLTLISAPAGYGKTTLMAALPSALSDADVAWLSLDEADSDLTRFLTAVVHALRSALPDSFAGTLSVLAGPARPGVDPRHLVAALVNDLLEGLLRPAVLVLDDLHLVLDPSVHVALDHLLERLPAELHLVVASRHDPPLSLARLRARGHLAEVRLSEIRFTAEEAAELLNDRFHLRLQPRDLARLHATTEGWPVGLRLLASSLSRIPTPEGRAVLLADLHRAEGDLFDYLASEVLDRQPPDLRSFLLETSILSELTQEACRAVTGRADAETCLEDLEARGLFVSAVEGPSPTYRYHALFASFLEGRLRRELPDRVGELHLRAARAATIPGQVIAHFLAAGSWEEAASAIESSGDALLRDGLIGTVAGWLQAIPVAVRSRRPRLGMLWGLCCFHLGDVPTARAELDGAASAFEAAVDREAAGEALAHLANCTFAQLDFAAAGAVVGRALACPLAPPQRVQLLLLRTWLAILQGPWKEALIDLEAALAEVDAAGTGEALAALALHLRLDLAGVPGALDRLEPFIARMVALSEATSSPLAVAVEELAACCHLWRGRLDRAVEGSERALAKAGRLGNHPYLGLPAAGFGSLAYLAKGDLGAAQRLIDVAYRRLVAIPLGRVYMAAPLYVRGKIRLLQGDLEGGREICRALWAAAADTESTEAPALRWKLRGLLDMAEGRYAEADRAFREALPLEDKGPAARLFGLARVLLARVALERNCPETALAELAPALAESEQAGTPGIILIDGAEAEPVLRLAVRRGCHAAFAARLLSMIPSAASRATVPIPSTGQLLTAREAEILGLVVQGASNRAIAERLAIELTTVKSHLTSIMRKLDVSSRMEAAALVRRLGLPLPRFDLVP